MKYFIIIILLSLNIAAADKYNIKFEGDVDVDVDLINSDFTVSTLKKILKIEDPAFYKIWRKNPSFDINETLKFKSILIKYAKSVGYYKAEVTSKIEKENIVYKIIKNKPVKINSIKIRDEYASLITVKKNRIFKVRDFKKSKDNIKRYLNKNGYPKYELKAKALIIIEENIVDITFEVKKNELHYIGPTTISIDNKVKERIIKDQKEYSSKEIFNIEKIERTYDNIYNLGIYENIIVEPILDKNSTTVPIKIDLKEGKTKEFKIGIGYLTDDGARASIGWKDHNFLGDLKTLEFILRGSQKGYELENKFTIPYIKLPWIGNTVFINNLKLSDLNYESYSELKLEDIISMNKKYKKTYHSLGFMFEKNEVTSKVLTNIENGSYKINSIFYNVILDQRDSLLNAKNGYLINVYIENSRKDLSSEFDSIKTMIEGRYIKTFSNYTTALKVKIGAISKPVHIFKRFFAGGSFSNRGYSYENFGEKDKNGNPYGGHSIIDSSIEERYQVSKNISTVFFIDSTMLSLKTNDYGGKFSHSYGAGIRYSTPVGPLRFDVGIPFGTKEYVMHFGLGQTF